MCLPFLRTFPLFLVSHKSSRGCEVAKPQLPDEAGGNGKDNALVLSGSQLLCARTR